MSGPVRKIMALEEGESWSWRRPFDELAMFMVAASAKRAFRSPYEALLGWFYGEAGQEWQLCYFPEGHENAGDYCVRQTRRSDILKETTNERN